MQQINIDLETYSDVNLSKAGVYKYADSENFRILLVGYSCDHGPVQQVDIALGEKPPQEFLDALRDPNVIKRAFNAQFERVCLSRYLGEVLDPASWRCTMVSSLYLGLPGSLAEVGEVLSLDKKKMTEGKDLIKLFCTPHEEKEEA